MGEQVRYISLFSGVEACSVAWHHMDNWKPEVFAEFDAFPSAVLKHQFPHVPNVGDVTKYDWKKHEGQIELIVGGSPCQSFSVAGKRLGMDDPRGNLALHYLRIIDEVKPTWFIFENVPGLLSSDNGRDFAAFLREVENIGYGCAYRILDAQYFGVPQRRRRLFVVGHIDGDWRRAAAVLFEPESLSGDSPPSRKAGQKTTTDAGSGIESRGEYWNGRGITNTLTAKGDDDRMPDKGRFHGVVVPEQTGTLDTELGSKLSTQAAQSGFLIPTQHPDEVSPTVTAKWSKGADTPPGQKIDNGNMIPVSVGVDLFNQEETGEIHVPLRTAQGHGAPAVMTTTQVPFRMAKAPMSKDDDTRWEETVAHPTLNTFAGHNENRLQSAVTVQVYENHGQDSRIKPVEVSPSIPARAGTGGNNLPIVTQVAAIPIHDQATRFSGKRGNNNDGKGNGLGIGKDGDPSNTLTKNDRHAVAQEVAFSHTQGFDIQASEVKFPTLRAEGNGQSVAQELAVRRLTPIECERLQGFPDNWTRIPWKGKKPENCPDGPRFKCMGNSMAVPVMRWIGEGIELVNRIPTNR